MILEPRPPAPEPPIMAVTWTFGLGYLLLQVVTVSEVEPALGCD